MFLSTFTLPESCSDKGLSSLYQQKREKLEKQES